MFTREITAGSQERITGEASLVVETQSDIINARLIGKQLSERAGFTGSRLTMLASAISTVARFIVSSSVSGRITIRIVNQNTRRGVVVTALCENLPQNPIMADQGPTQSRLQKVSSTLKQITKELEILTKPGDDIIIRFVCLI